MHDVVGHSFSVVLLHLAGARTVLDSDPAKAADALRRAEDVGRRGMDDLRQTIGLLRSGGETLQAVTAAADLAALVDEYRMAGLGIDATLDPAVDDVAGAARIVTHDVVREALTNCAKHEPSSAVEVSVGVSDACVEVRVGNDCASRPQPSDGAGLIGLLQRVKALDGDFEAGPSTTGSSWVVHARIPRQVDASHGAERTATSTAPIDERTSTPT